MKQGIAILLVACLLATGLYLQQSRQSDTGITNDSPTVNLGVLPEIPVDTPDTQPARAVLDISVHTEQELRVLLDRIAWSNW